MTRPEEVTNVPSTYRQLWSVSVNLYGSHSVVYITLTTLTQSNKTQVFF